MDGWTSVIKRKIKFICVPVTVYVPYHAVLFRNGKRMKYYIKWFICLKSNNFGSYIVEILKVFCPENSLQIRRLLNVTWVAIIKYQLCLEYFKCNVLK